MIWVATSSNFLNPSAVLHDEVNTKDYLSILAGYLLSMAQTLFWMVVQSSRTIKHLFTSLISFKIGAQK